MSKHKVISFFIFIGIIIQSLPALSIDRLVDWNTIEFNLETALVRGKSPVSLNGLEYIVTKTSDYELIIEIKYPTKLANEISPKYKIRFAELDTGELLVETESTFNQKKQLSSKTYDLEYYHRLFGKNQANQIETSKSLLRTELATRARPEQVAAELDYEVHRQQQNFNNNQASKLSYVRDIPAISVITKYVSNKLIADLLKADFDARFASTVFTQNLKSTAYNQMRANQWLKLSAGIIMGSVIFMASTGTSSPEFLGLGSFMAMISFAYKAEAAQYRAKYLNQSYKGNYVFIQSFLKPFSALLTRAKACKAQFNRNWPES